jgi:hypothetical protein
MNNLEEGMCAQTKENGRNIEKQNKKKEMQINHSLINNQKKRRKFQIIVQ